jgi:hypothetical protein
MTGLLFYKAIREHIIAIFLLSQQQKSAFSQDSRPPNVAGVTSDAGKS